MESLHFVTSCIYYKLFKLKLIIVLFPIIIDFSERNNQKIMEKNELGRKDSKVSEVKCGFGDRSS